jgi:erythromycin esterase-like protein
LKDHDVLRCFAGQAMIAIVALLFNTNASRTKAQPFLNNDLKQVGRERDMLLAWGPYGGGVSFHTLGQDSFGAIEIRGETASARGGIIQAFPLLGVEGRSLSISLRARIDARAHTEAEVCLSIGDLDAMPKRTLCQSIQAKENVLTTYNLTPIHIPLEGRAISVQLGVRGQCSLTVSEVRISIDNEPLELFCKNHWKHLSSLYLKQIERSISMVPWHPDSTIDCSSIINRSGLAGKRLILLGECAHGSHELQRLRTQITRALAKEKNFRFVVLETSMADMPAVNEYLVKGVGDLDDLLRRSVWSGYDSRDLREMLELIRLANKGRQPAERIVLWGCDCYLPNGAAANVRAAISEIDSSLKDEVELAYNAVKTLGYVSGDAVPPQRFSNQWRFEYQRTHDAWVRWVAIQRKLSQKEDDLAVGMPGDRVRWICQNAKLVSQGLEFMLLSSSDSVHDERDQFMFENILWILGQQEKESFGLVCCHNGHASLRHHAMGSYLKRKLDDGLLVIGSTFRTGSFLAMETSNGGMRRRSFEVLPLCGGNLEELLPGAPKMATICDFRSVRRGMIETGKPGAWMYIRSCGSIVKECEVSAGPVLDWFDVLICVPNSTPVQPPQ